MKNQSSYNAMEQSTILESEVLRPTHIEVDLNQLTKNYNAISASTSAKIMAVLKANAYGHGLIPTAQHLESIGCVYFAVAFLEEGLLLRKAGIKAPILVLGGIFNAQIPLFIENDLTLTASSVDKLLQIEQTAEQMKKKAKVHLKIDTGMERIGIHYYTADKLIIESNKCKNCDVEGIYSHFANSEDLEASKVQLNRFNEVLKIYSKENIPTPQLRHIANSGALLQLPDSHFDMVRTGLLLYGTYPDQKIPKTIKVDSILSWKTKVSFFKVVKPDHPVSYGHKWKSDKMVRVVTLPIGYGDGYFHRMTGNAEVLIGGKRYPVVGSICMDQMMVNIEWDSAYNGDEVTLIGKEGNESITVEDLASWAGTITYEVLTNINTRVPRIYKK